MRAASSAAARPPRSLSCALLLALPAAAPAAQWLALPAVTVSADADSNRRLRPVARESEGGVLAASAYLARLTETDALALTPHLMVNRYSGEDALDSDDWGVHALWRHTGERTQLELDTSHSDDSTLATELGETGFIEGNTRRRATSAGATFTQLLETRHSLQYALAGTDVDYLRARLSGLIGYRNSSASVLYAFSNTARVATTLGISAARLDAPDAHVRSDTRGAQLGLRVRAGERCDVDVRAGTADTRADGRSDREYTFHAGVTWKGERSSLELSASRDVEPSGRGVPVNADDLRVRYTRDLTEKLALNATLRASRREDLALGFGGIEYRYDAAVASLDWQLDELWTLSLAGAYSRQDYSDVRAAADGTRLGLALSWRPLQP